MAKTSGSAAYQRLTVPQTDMGETARAFGAISAANRRHARGLNQRNKELDDAKKEADKKAANEKLIKVSDKLQASKTGYSSIDEGVADYIYNDLANQILEQGKILEQDPNNWRAHLELDRIARQPAEIKAMTDQLVAKRQALETGIKDGTLSPSLNKDVIQKYDALARDYNFKLGYENGRTKLFVDTNNDGIDDSEQEGITANDLLTGTKMSEFAPYFNGDGYITAQQGVAAKALSDSTTEDGEITTRWRGLRNQYVKALDGDINLRLGAEYDDLTPQGKSFVIDYLGEELPKNQQEWEAQKLKLKEPIIASVPTLYSKTEDEPKSDSKSDSDVGISFVESNQYGNTPEATVNRYAFNSPYVMKGTSKSEKPKTFYEIRYDKQNGNVAVMGREYNGKLSTKETIVENEDGGFAIFDNQNKTYTTVSEDDWKDVSITDKAEVTAILSKPLGVDSYAKIVEKLKGEETAETTQEETNNDPLGLLD